MVRTQIQLTEEQARRLKAIASERSVSMATLIREGVEHVLESDERRLRRERMISHIGGFHSGRGDISERHDDYLAEAFED